MEGGGQEAGEVTIRPWCLSFPFWEPGWGAGARLWVSPVLVANGSSAGTPQRRQVEGTPILLVSLFPGPEHMHRPGPGHCRLVGPTARASGVSRRLRTTS